MRFPPFLALIAGLFITRQSIAQEETVRYFQPVLSPAITASAAGARGDIRALVVGLSRYQHEGFAELPFARRDAEAFAAFLKTPYGGGITSEDLVLLTDETATLAQFTDAVYWLLSESRKGDKIVVYCAGGAQLKEQGPPRLLFFDSPPAPTDAGYFSLEKLTGLLGEAAREKGVRVFFCSEFRPILEKRPYSGNWDSSEKKNGLRFEKLGQAKQSELSDSTAQNQSFGRAMLSGLLGLADADDNQRILGPELTQYLKQWGKKHPASGNYACLAFPYNDDWICKARENARLTLGGQMESFFTPILQLEVQPLDQFMVTHADSATRRLYEDFILTIRLGQLLAPPERCAAGLLDSLLRRPELGAVHKQLQRRMAVAYQDDTQQALNAYLQTSAKELVRRRKNREHYKLYPQYLQRTIDILGAGHFMARLLQAKLLYFEGLSLRLEYEKQLNAALLPEALEKQERAAALEPEAAFVYNEMGVVRGMMGNYHTADSLFQIATEYSPTWSVPYSNRSYTMLLLNRIDDARELGVTAVSLGHWSPHTYLTLGEVYQKKGELGAAENLYRRALLIDPQSPLAWYNLACTAALREDHSAAIESLGKAFEYGFDRPDQVWANPDLGVLREKPAFRKLMSRYFPEFPKK